MNLRAIIVDGFRSCTASLFAIALLSGCASTPETDWASLVGSYTYAEAVTDLGKPTRVEPTADGGRVAEWSKPRTYTKSMTALPPSYGQAETRGMNTYGTVAPDKVLRLTFDAQGKLVNWSRNY